VNHWVILTEKSLGETSTAICGGKEKGHPFSEEKDVPFL
jgi:hypothetical protein